jgi:phytoene/squalene synthetase
MIHNLCELMERNGFGHPITKPMTQVMWTDIDDALYECGWSGIAYLKREGQLAVGAAISLYRCILGRIVKKDFDVFTRRAPIWAPRPSSAASR